MECLPSFEGIVLGQPLGLHRPLAPIRRPLEASILRNWIGDITAAPFYVYSFLRYSLSLLSRLHTIVSFATLISYMEHKFPETPSIRAGT